MKFSTKSAVIGRFGQFLKINVAVIGQSPKCTKFSKNKNNNAFIQYNKHSISKCILVISKRILIINNIQYGIYLFIFIEKENISMAIFSGDGFPIFLIRIKFICFETIFRLRGNFTISFPTFSFQINKYMHYLQCTITFANKSDG